jgi:hypothetical protein
VTKLQSWMITIFKVIVKTPYVVTFHKLRLPSVNHNTGNIPVPVPGTGMLYLELWNPPPSPHKVKTSGRGVKTTPEAKKVKKEKRIVNPIRIWSHRRCLLLCRTDTISVLNIFAALTFQITMPSFFCHYRLSGGFLSYAIQPGQSETSCIRQY